MGVIRDMETQAEHLEVLEGVEPAMRDAYQRALLMDLDHEKMVCIVVEEDLGDGNEVTVSVVNERVAISSLVANGFASVVTNLVIMHTPSKLRVIVATKNGLSLMSRLRESLILTGVPN